MLDLLIVIPTFVAAFLSTVFIGRWILGPIDRAAALREAPARFSIGDFLCLFLVVQIPLAAIYQTADDDWRVPFWILTILTWIVAPLIWFAAAGALSKAGVTSSKHRFVFLSLLVPIAYYALIPFAILSAIGAFNLFRGQIHVFVEHSFLLLLWIGAAILFYLSGLYTRWMIRQVERDRAAAQDIYGDGTTIDNTLD